MIKVVIEKEHLLFDKAIDLFNKKFGEDNWELLSLAMTDLTVEEQKKMADELMYDKNTSGIVFIDIAPVLFGILSSYSGYASCLVECGGKSKILDIFVLHQDKSNNIELVRIV